jgi:hypothetical protein
MGAHEVPRRATPRPSPAGRLCELTEWCCFGGPTAKNDAYWAAYLAVSISVTSAATNFVSACSYPSGTRSPPVGIAPPKLAFPHTSRIRHGPYVAGIFRAPSVTRVRPPKLPTTTCRGPDSSFDRAAAAPPARAATDYTRYTIYQYTESPPAGMITKL